MLNSLVETAITLCAAYSISNFLKKGGKKYTLEAYIGNGFLMVDIFFQIYGPANPSYPCSPWTLDTNGHIQTSVLPPVKLPSSSAFPVATSMANSTTSAMKIMPPGPAGRSSPEGSQVSPLFIHHRMPG